MTTTCSKRLLREEELERQFDGIFAGFEFPEAIVESNREALQQRLLEDGYVLDRKEIELLRAAPPG